MEFSKGRNILKAYEQSKSIHNTRQIVKQFRVIYRENGQCLARICKCLQREAPLSFRVPHGDFCRKISGYVERIGNFLCLWDPATFDFYIPADPREASEGYKFEAQLIRATHKLVAPLIDHLDVEAPTDTTDLNQLVEIPGIIADIQECITPRFYFSGAAFLSSLEKLSLSFSNALIAFLGKIHVSPGELNSRSITEPELSKIRSQRVVDVHRFEAYMKCVSDSRNTAYDCLPLIFNRDRHKTGKSGLQRYKIIIEINTAINEVLVQQNSLSISSWKLYKEVFQKLIELIDTKMELDRRFCNSLVQIWNLKIKDPAMKPTIESLMLTLPKGLPLIFLNYLKETRNYELRVALTHHYLHTNCRVWFRYVANCKQVGPIISNPEFEPFKLEEGHENSEFLDIYNSFLNAYYNCVIKHSTPLTFPLYSYEQGKEVEQVGRALIEFIKNLMQLVDFTSEIPKCFRDLVIINQRLVNFYISRDLLSVDSSDIIFLRDLGFNFPS